MDLLIEATSHLQDLIMGVKFQTYASTIQFMTAVNWTEEEELRSYDASPAGKYYPKVEPSMFEAS